MTPTLCNGWAYSLEATRFGMDSLIGHGCGEAVGTGPHGTGPHLSETYGDGHAWTDGVE